MRSLSLLAVLVSITSTSATPGGRCASGFSQTACICLDQSYCVSLGGHVDAGSPGRWPCPYDADNIIGCSFVQNCPGMDASTMCVWRPEGCNGGTTRVLPNAVCPGPDDFVCCDLY